MLVLDAGGVSRLAERSSAGAARIALLKETGGSVITSDLGALRALAAHADGVVVERA